MPGTSRPIAPALGLEVTGLTTDELVTPEGARKAQEALDRYGVVVYREINIDDDDLLALSRMMGTLVVQPTGEHKHPEIQTITLDPTKTNALLASFRQGNFHWHIDGATDERPAEGNAADCARGRPRRRRHRVRHHLCRLRGVVRWREGRDRLAPSGAQLRPRPVPGQSRPHRRGACRLGPGSRASAPAGLAAP